MWGEHRRQDHCLVSLVGRRELARVRGRCVRRDSRRVIGVELGDQLVVELVREAADARDERRELLAIDALEARPACKTTQPSGCNAKAAIPPM